jgi:hypothetical protein
VWQAILTFIIKVTVGVMLTTLIEFKMRKKKNKNMSRQFDNLSNGCREAILTDMVALAKQYETIEETGDDIELLATDFGQVYLLTVEDFLAINVEMVVEWVGPRPQKPPRIE